MIGKRLFEIGEIKGMKSIEIANKMGVSRACACQFKKKEDLKFETVRRICEAIGCDIVLEDRDTGLRYKL